MHKKLPFAIVLLVVLCVATAAIIYSSQFTAQLPKQVLSGVSVGDTFTYSLKGSAILSDDNAVIPGYFSQYNKTDYFKVTITEIKGSEVSFNTAWRFTNGTEINNEQKIDLSSGNRTADFWAIYASNLNVNDLLHPTGFDGLIVNSTQSIQYKDSLRGTNFWSTETQYFNINDPTESSQRFDLMQVRFDKQTGMLVDFISRQLYNNPAMTLAITWKLTNSTAWAF
jgi:hypothetical protein